MTTGRFIEALADKHGWKFVPSYDDYDGNARPEYWESEDDDRVNSTEELLDILAKQLELEV